MSKRARILIDDSIGRFEKDEVGVVLGITVNNSDKKYDYFIGLEPFIAKETTSPFIQNGDRLARNFYFYKNEVEILE